MPASPLRAPFTERAACLLLALVTATACAAPMTQMGAVSREDVQREQLRQQQFTIESDWKAQSRLEAVALPLLEAAVPLCGEKVAVRSGVAYASVHSYKRDWQAAARAAGLSDTLSIVGVVPGSAAEHAGLRRGDRVLSVAGKPVPVGARGMAEADARLKAHFAASRVRADRKADGTGDSPAAALPVTFASSTLPLRVARADSVIDVTVLADTICAQRVVAVRDDALNAYADGDAIYVTSAMVRFATEPGELETVVAHEIAHNAMRHIDAKKKNMLAGALFGAIIDIAAASQGINTGGEYTNQMAALASMSFSQDFEREADYVGLYVMARAGHDIGHSASLWRRMAVESPGSIRFASSHPTTAERYIRLDRTVEEIRRKQAAGVALVPEMTAP